MSFKAKTESRKTRRVSPEAVKTITELEQEPLQSLYLKIPDSLHRALKMAVIEEKTTIKKLLIQLINNSFK